MTTDQARAILGIGAAATPDEIHRCYRRLAAAAHPDAGGSAAAFQRLRQAYDLLTGPSSEEVQALAVKRQKLKLDLIDINQKIEIEQAKCKQYSPTDFRRKILADLLLRKAKLES